MPARRHRRDETRTTKNLNYIRWVEKKVTCALAGHGIGVYVCDVDGCGSLRPGIQERGRLPSNRGTGVCAESRRCQGQTRDNIAYSKPQRTPGPLQEGTGGRRLFVTPDARSRPRRSCRQGKNNKEPKLRSNKEPNLRSPRRLPRNNTRLLRVRDATATL